MRKGLLPEYTLDIAIFMNRNRNQILSSRRTNRTTLVRKRPPVRLRKRSGIGYKHPDVFLRRGPTLSEVTLG